MAPILCRPADLATARTGEAGQRLTPTGLDRLPPLDLLLISHNHYDHLDVPTVRTLPRATPVVVPGGLGRWFRRRGFTDVTELDWWESVGGRPGGQRPRHSRDGAHALGHLHLHPHP